ncbi:hypothetical protein [Chelatococcus reniformis]|uniref:Lipoprotein n=1 Tax=Chelatococcus reniformis TaxID=1494448 RepID=A0A916UIF2_9HYPH|nr:hypothetical protein [Chelatococcus reniformis]GGC74090.1 hypothetical protein GCM10010994_35570 [Chelatococcus reniformis]
MAETPSRPRERGPTRVALLIAAAVGALGACIVIAVLTSLPPALDAAAARLCQAAIPALNDDGVGLKFGRAVTGPVQDSLRIDYIATAAGGAARRREVTCRFERTEPHRAPRLAGIATEGGPLSDSSFYFLNRFFLEQSGEGPAASPPAPPPATTSNGSPGRNGEK